VEDAQRVTIREQSVDGMVQFQAVPITNMIPNANRQKEYRKIKLTELTAQEREEQRKRNANRQREYRERRSKQLEDARKQFIEQQKNQDVEQEIQNSTNILVEPTVEDAQRLMVSEQHVDDMVQFQAGPITNMIPNSDRQKEYRKKSCMN